MMRQIDSSCNPPIAGRGDGQREGGGGGGIYCYDYSYPTISGCGMAEQQPKCTAKVSPQIAALNTHQ